MVLGRRDRYLDTVARRVFHADVDAARASRTVATILGALRTIPIEAGTCADEDCNRAGVMAHVTSDLSTVVLCPRFFLIGPGQMRRTLIHEAGHAAGIDASLAAADEDYCTELPTIDCTDPCGNLSGRLDRNVDAWANYVECAAFSS